jgi:hypothetical protein
MKKIVILFVLANHFAGAQSINPGYAADTGLHTLPVLHTPKWHERTAFRTVLAPALLVGYGIATIGKQQAPISSQDVQHWRQRNYSTFSTDMDDYMPSASLVLMFGLDAAGVESRHHWMNQAIIFGLANAMNGFSTKRLKHMTGVARPDGRDKLSFPSGHTSSAFVAAEMLHQEFRDKSVWISVAGYSLASTVGALRIMNNRHWMSDVFAGAGVGILSVRLTYLAYPVIQKFLCERVLHKAPRKRTLVP